MIRVLHVLNNATPYNKALLYTAYHTNLELVFITSQKRC